MTGIFTPTAQIALSKSPLLCSENVSTIRAQLDPGRTSALERRVTRQDVPSEIYRAGKGEEGEKKERDISEVTLGARVAPSNFETGVRLLTSGASCIRS